MTISRRMVQLEQLFAGTGVDLIDDAGAAADRVWSAQKVSVQFGDVATALIDKAAATHTHAIADVTGLQAGLDSKINLSLVGAVNGLAPLDASSLIPAIYLPSYVDDVLEYANLAAFPGAGVAGKIYVAIDTSKPYRWSGSTYIEISPSPGSTDGVTEGATNLYFSEGRVRSALLTGVTDTAGTVAGTDSILVGFGKLRKGLADANTAIGGKASLTGATFTGSITVPAEAYGPGWDGSNEAPTKNDIYDKIETIAAGGGGADITAANTWTGAQTFSAAVNGNAIVTLSPAGTGVYSGFQMKGNGGSLALGLDLLAGGGEAYWSADAFTFRNAAQSANFLTLGSWGTSVNGNFSVNGAQANFTVTDVTFGHPTGAAADTTVWFDNTNVYNFWTFRRWAAGVSTTQASLVVSDAGYYWGAGNHTFRSLSGADIFGAFSSTGLSVTGAVTVIGPDATLTYGERDGGDSYLTYFASNTLNFYSGGVVRMSLTTGGDLNVAGTLSQGGTAVSLVGHTQAATTITVTATARFLGRVTASAGAVEELTATQLKTALGLAAADVGLGNVDNTTDAAKPVSTAQQTALNLKANLAPNIQTPATNAASIVPTFSNDQVNLTGHTVAVAIAAPTGTAVDGWGIVLRVQDNGTARAWTWNAIFRAATGLTLPTTTVVGKTHYVAMVYNAGATKWDVLSIASV